MRKLLLGQATDALERPSVESLTNQDAEPAVEAPLEDPRRKPRGRSRSSTPELVSSFQSLKEVATTMRAGLEVEDMEDRGVPLNQMEFPLHYGLPWRSSRRLRQEKRPPENRRALANFQEGGSSSSSAPPAAVARNNKDNWEVIGDKLIRYHYFPRRELFSPDLTDCPIPLSRISDKRVTNIIPIGGIDIIDDEDSWHNVRRRNKKFSFRWIGKTEFIILPTPTPNGDGAVVADFPAMPVCIDGQQQQHRDKISKPLQLSEEDIHDGIAMVARPVAKKELLANPKLPSMLNGKSS